MNDARVTNHMDPETREIHFRLVRWGQLCREQLPALPSMTLLGRIIKFGITGASQTRGPISLPDDVAEIDAAIGRLCEIDRTAVRIYYMRSTDDTPIEDCARRCADMSVTQYRNVLRRSRWRLALSLANLKTA